MDKSIVPPFLDSRCIYTTKIVVGFYVFFMKCKLMVEVTSYLH